MKMKCDIINDLLPLYVDGVLSQDSKELIEEHLEECENCRKIFENMKEKIQISTNKEVRMDEVKLIKGLKKMVLDSKLRIAITSAVLVIIVFAMSIIIPHRIFFEVSYDGNNITVEQIGKEIVVCHNEKGQLHIYGEGNPETGEWEVSFVQTLWGKYIYPLYNAHSNISYFCNLDEATKISYINGEILWEATNEQKELYFEKYEKEMELYREVK